MLIKLFKDSFTLTSNNLIITYPLILFLWIIAMLVDPMRSYSTSSWQFWAIALNIVGLMVAFWAGWFNMFSSLAINYKKDPNIVEQKVYSFDLLKEFVPGVGSCFVSILIGMILYLVLFVLFFSVAGFLGFKLIGIPEAHPEKWTHILYDKTALYNFVHGLSAADKLILVKWNMLTLFFMNLFSFITMFWMPIVVSRDVNPIKAFGINIMLIIKNPASVFLIYVFYLFANTVLSLLSSVSGNFILQLITMTLMLLFVTYFFVLLFMFIEEKNENTRSSGLDSIG